MNESFETKNWKSDFSSFLWNFLLFSPQYGLLMVCICVNYNNFRQICEITTLNRYISPHFDGKWQKTVIFDDFFISQRCISVKKIYPDMSYTALFSYILPLNFKEILNKKFWASFRDIWQNVARQMVTFWFLTHYSLKTTDKFNI